VTQVLLVTLHLARGALLGGAALLTAAIGWAADRDAMPLPLSSGGRRNAVTAAARARPSEQRRR
jgi:hypothetical protein